MILLDGNTIKIENDNSVYTITIDEAKEIARLYEEYTFRKQILEFITDKPGFFKKSLFDEYPDSIDDKEFINAVLKNYTEYRADNELTARYHTAWFDCLSQAVRDTLNDYPDYRKWWDNKNT